MKKQIRKWFSLVATLTIVMTVLSLYAANVHLKGGNPTFTDNGTTATVCATLTGLGNQDLTVTLAGSGVETTVCLNPNGNFAPGNPGEVVVGGAANIPAGEIKNGTVSFCVSTVAPVCKTAKDCGCPNNNWSATVSDVDFTSMTLIVEQGGKVVFSTQVK